MSTSRLFRTATWVASLAAWGGWCMPTAHAQVDAWAIGNQAVVMPPGTNGPADSPIALPIPNDAAYPAAYQYQGQSALRSQHVRTAGDGRILFFEVDGNLYDGDGYMIADTRANDCNECIDPGVMEFLSVPVPGTCDLFYLYTGVADGSTGPNSGTYIQWSLLDMKADNPRFPVLPPATCPRKGRLVNLDGELGVGDYNQFEDMLGELIVEMNTPFIGPNTSVHVGRLLSGAVHSNAPRFRVVESNTGGDHWLFSIIDNHVYVYRLASNGIFRVNPLSGQAHVPIKTSAGGGAILDYFFDADAILTSTPSHPNGVLALAIAERFSLYMHPDAGTSGKNLLVHYFDPTSGAVYLNDAKGYSVYTPPSACAGVGIPVPGGSIAHGLRGCAFRSDGNGLYLTGERTTDCQSFQPYVIHLDLVSDAITGLEYAFGGPIDEDWVRTRIHRNTEVGGSGTAIYFPYGGQVGALEDLSDLSTVTFSATAISQVSPPILFNGDRPVGCGYVPRFLDIGVVHDRYLSAENRGNCCTFLNMHGSGRVYGHRQSAGMQPTSWTAIANPYGDTSPLTCVCEVVVEDGAQLYASNLDLQFAPEAKIIVERGGRLHKSNTWTTSLNCPGDRWPGIRVEGTTINGEQTSAAQGQLRIYGGGVRNAIVGAWAAREVGNTGIVDGAYYGGMIRVTSNATFRDCITGARVERYQRTSSTGAILPNLSLFSGCTFETTQDWPGGTPKYHAQLYDVQGIKFLQCKFKNDAPGLFPLLNRGWGIFGLLAGFDVEGSSVQDASLFQDLSVGVLAATGTLRKANIRRTWFRDNLIGAYMQGCTAPEVSRSDFIVPISNSPYAPTGLVLHQSTAYLVEENTFFGGGMLNGNIGIHIMGDVLAENRIYNNEFTGMNAGTYVVGRHKGGISPPTEFLGLQLLCSDYTGCGLDYYLHNNTYIKAAQGYWNGVPQESQLVANRFYSGAINGVTISAVQPDGPNAPFFNYLRHNVPECDPLNQSQYYSDIPVGPNSFNKAEACGNGLLPDIGGGNGIVGFQLAASQLLSAQAYFTGTVDIGEREDIMVAIRQEDPVLPSHTLRDYLLARCPLSDEVLLAVIHRPEPLDAWHLTQVMLGNARLTSRVLRALETCGLLNEYMLAIVQNAGSGPTVKDLLRQEVELRAMQKARMQTIAIDEIASDSLMVAPQDSLYAMLAAYPDPSDFYLLSGIAMERGDHATATAWLDSLQAARDDGHEMLRDLVDMDQVLGGDWDLADEGMRSQLSVMASSDSPGAAMAWAILYRLGETAEVPTAEMPDGSKSLSFLPAKATRAAERPLLEAHPNPTAGQSWIVIGMEVDEAAMVRISDPMGRMLHMHRLAPGQRLLEVDLSGVANGFYTCELLQGEFKLGVVKLTVQR